MIAGFLILSLGFCLCFAFGIALLMFASVAFEGTPSPRKHDRATQSDSVTSRSFVTAAVAAR